jgi:hypothetical protein
MIRATEVHRVPTACESARLLQTDSVAARVVELRRARRRVTVIVAAFSSEPPLTGRLAADREVVAVSDYRSPGFGGPLTAPTDPA